MEYHGFFQDGDNVAKPVRLEISEDTITFMELNGGPQIESWPVSGLILIEDRQRVGELLLSAFRSPQSVLTLTDPAFISFVKSRCAPIWEEQRKGGSRWLYLAAAVAVFAVLYAVFA